MRIVIVVLIFFIFPLNAIFSDTSISNTKTHSLIVTVMPFYNKTQQESMSYLSEVLADSLASTLSKNPELNIDRQKISSLINETKVEQPLLFVDDTAYQFASILNSNVILEGLYNIENVRHEKVILLTIKVLDTLHAKLIARHQISGRNDENLFQELDRLSEQIFQDIIKAFPNLTNENISNPVNIFEKTNSNTSPLKDIENYSLFNPKMGLRCGIFTSVGEILKKFKSVSVYASIYGRDDFRIDNHWFGLEMELGYYYLTPSDQFINQIKFNELINGIMIKPSVYYKFRIGRYVTILPLLGFGISIETASNYYKKKITNVFPLVQGGIEVHIVFLSMLSMTFDLAMGYIKDPTPGWSVTYIIPSIGILFSF